MFKSNIAEITMKNPRYNLCVINKSSTDDVSLKKFLGVKKEREKILSSFGIRREIEIIFIDGDKEIKIKIIR